MCVIERFLAIKRSSRVLHGSSEGEFNEYFFCLEPDPKFEGFFRTIHGGGGRADVKVFYNCFDFLPDGSLGDFSVF